MGLINENGQSVSREDLELAKRMMRDSIDSHLKRLQWYIKSNGDPVKAMVEPLIKEYQDGLSQIDRRFDEAFRSGEDIKITDFMTSFSDDIADKAASKLNKNDEYYFDFLMFVGTGFGNPAYRRLATNKPDEVREEQDSEAAYRESTDNFMFAEAAMEGIGDIPDYDPNSESVKALYTARAGNSNTLRKTLEDFEVQKQEVMDNEFLDEEAKAEHIKNIDENIESYKKGVFGLNTAAEVARIHSVRLNNKDKITISDVFSAYSDLNIANRPADADGGKLRGQIVMAGDIRGVTASAVPPMLYRVLEDITDYMNEIKQTPDPALRKTRALQLAAFSFQTMLSGHFFDDANGRTCRMFADTILQTFGLPPHTPLPEIETKVKTMGSQFDHRAVTNIFMDGIKRSNETLQQIRAEADEKRREKESAAREKERTAKDIADRNKKLTDPVYRLNVWESITVSRFEREALINNRMPSAPLNDLMNAVLVFGSGLPLNQLEDAYKNLISKADRYIYGQKTDIDHSEKVRWAQSLKAQARTALTDLQTALEFNDFSPEEMKLPANSSYFNTKEKNVQKEQEALEEEKNLPPLASPEDYSIPENGPKNVTNVEDAIDGLIQKLDSIQDMKGKLAVIADINVAENLGITRPGYSDRVLKALTDHIMLDENGNVRPEAQNIGQDIGELIGQYRLSAYRKIASSGNKDAKWSMELMRAEGLSSGFSFPEVFSREYHVDITGFPAAVDAYLKANSTEEERNDMKTVGMSDSGDISRQRSYSLEAAYRKELMSSIPEITMGDDYIASLAGLKDGINQSLAAAEKYKNSEDIKSITGSIDSMMEQAALRTAINNQANVAKISVRTSSRIMNFMEREALDPAWHENKNEVRKSLLAALKFTDPEMADRYLQKEELLRARTEEISRGKELITDYFEAQSSSSKDTLKKLVEANGSNKTESLAKMGAIIEKRYGLGKEISLELARGAKEAIDRIKERKEDPVSAFDSSAKLMKAALGSITALQMNRFEISKKGEQVRAALKPLLNDERVKFIDNTRHCSKTLKALLQDPGAFDRMKEMFDTKKNYRLLNWNSSEYNEAKKALDDFTKERDSLLKLADSYDGRELTEAEDKALNDQIDRANEKIAGCVDTLEKYIRKEGMEDITNKSQGAGLARITGAKGLADIFIKADKDLADRFPDEIKQSVNKDKIKLRSYSELYKEEYQKAEKEGTKDRHRNAAKSAKKRLDKQIIKGNVKER